MHWCSLCMESGWDQGIQRPGIILRSQRMDTASISQGKGAKGRMTRGLCAKARNKQETAVLGEQQALVMGGGQSAATFLEKRP